MTNKNRRERERDEAGDGHKERMLLITLRQCGCVEYERASDTVVIIDRLEIPNNKINDTARLIAGVYIDGS
jgi:hypothetical protein